MGYIVTYFYNQTNTKELIEDKFIVCIEKSMIIEIETHNKIRRKVENIPLGEIEVKYRYL